MDVMDIISPSNQVAKRVRLAAAGRLKDVILIEGRHLLREAIRAGWPLEAVLVRADCWIEWSNLLQSSHRLRQTYRVPEELFRRLSTLASPEGILALGRRPRAPFPSPRDGDVYLYLDAVQDPVNTGILVRSAKAFGLACVFAGEGTCDPFRLTALFRSGGAAFHLPVPACTGDEFLQWAGQNGVALVAAVSGGTPLKGASVPPRTPLALILGNEGRGISPRILDRCNVQVGISMDEGWDSLNVAAAGSILMHAFSTRRERE